MSVTALGVGIVRWAVGWNRDLCRWFDARFVSPTLRRSGSAFFRAYLREYGGYRQGMTVVDLGSGKHPSIPTEIVERFELHIVGFDISEDELEQAPAGYYDRYLVADVMNYRGDLTADLVVTHALLEHVEDNKKAMSVVSSVLERGSELLCFVPSRNAIFSRINLIMPEWLKIRLLFALFPKKRSNSGFKAYYDRCSPRQFETLLQEAGFEVEEEHLFHQSSYFSFFFPLYLLWRGYVVLGWLVSPRTFAESFVVRVRKVSERSAAPPTDRGAPGKPRSAA